MSKIRRNWFPLTLLLCILACLVFVVVVFAQVSPQIQGAGAPSNPCNNGGQQYVDQTNHVIYSCPSSGGNWVNIGLGQGTTILGGNTLTTGTIPKATSSNQIGNSLLDDGVTTPNALTYSGNRITIQQNASTGSDEFDLSDTESNGVLFRMLNGDGGAANLNIFDQTKSRYVTKHFAGAAAANDTYQILPSGGAVSTGGSFSAASYLSGSNCQLGGASGTTSPAACSAAPAGMIAVPASQTSYTVNTTAVTANSEIFVQQMTDNSGLPSSPTCNSGATSPIQSARVAATSFTLTQTSVASVTCFKYWIVN